MSDGPAMTLNKDGLEAARDAFEEVAGTITSELALRRAITAYLASLPTPDGLVERLESALRDMPSLNHAPIDKAMYRRTMLVLAATVREAVTALSNAP